MIPLRLGMRLIRYCIKYIYTRFKGEAGQDLNLVRARQIAYLNTQVGPREAIESRRR